MFKQNSPSSCTSDIDKIYYWRQHSNIIIIMISISIVIRVLHPAACQNRMGEQRLKTYLIENWSLLNFSTNKHFLIMPARLCSSNSSSFCLHGMPRLGSVYPLMAGRGTSAWKAWQPFYINFPERNMRSLQSDLIINFVNFKYYFKKFTTDVDADFHVWQLVVFIGSRPEFFDMARQFTMEEVPPPPPSPSTLAPQSTHIECDVLRC